MAKHDRRKTSGQPPSSRPVTIQVPLPVLGVVNGVREAFHGCYGMTPCQLFMVVLGGGSVWNGRGHVGWDGTGRGGGRTIADCAPRRRRREAEMAT